MSNSPDLHSPAAQPHAAAKAGAACPSRAAPATIPSDLIEEAIVEAFGDRCSDYAEGCPCCDVWKQYDDLRAAAIRSNQEGKG